MEIVKVRRVGNSNVVTLPRALEALGCDTGAYIAQDVHDGTVALRPIAAQLDAVRDIGRQATAHDRSRDELERFPHAGGG